MITKAILIKPADKWMVRVWETEEPKVENFIIAMYSNFEEHHLTWLNSYKEYEVHPDYAMQCELVCWNVYRNKNKQENVFYDLKKQGIDLNPELIDFKAIVIDWDIIEGDVEKTYAILKDVADERDCCADFKKARAIVSELLDVDSVWNDVYEQSANINQEDFIKLMKQIYKINKL